MQPTHRGLCLSGHDDEFMVEDRRGGRHGIVWKDEWDSPRFRLLSPVQRCVYVTLTQYVGASTGQCWPKVSTLMGVVGCGESTVRHAISQLKALGYLTVGKVSMGQRKRVNLYTLRSPPPFPPPPALDGGDNGDH